MPEQLLQFRTGAPVEVTIDLRKGQQLPATFSSPTLAPRSEAPTEPAQSPTSPR